MNVDRRSRLLTLLGLWIVFAAGTPPAHAQGKKFALLIGVDKYPEGSGFTSLPYTERDVEGLAELLLASGYRPENVRVLTLTRGNQNTRFLPTVRNTRREFNLIAADRKPDDSLIVALSGHGISRGVTTRDAAGATSVKHVAHFCPIDADISDPESMLSLDDFYTTLERSEARTKVMFVDACRNDPTDGRAGAIPFTSTPPPPSVAALFACSNGEVAWDAGELGGGHGVFFHFIIDGLKGNADLDGNGRVTLAELAAHTQDRVPDYVSARRGKRQMPLLQGVTGRITLLELAAADVRRPDPPLRVPPRPSFAESIGIKIVPIPAGSFMMGSSDNDLQILYPLSPDNQKTVIHHEWPQHLVRIDKIDGLGAHEVSVGQFRRFVEDTGYSTEPERDGKGGIGFNRTSTAAYPFFPHPQYNWRDTGYPQDDDHPVVNVTWADARAFCRWLTKKDGRTYRLPTEAEWEYACRAGTVATFGDSNNPNGLTRVANVADESLRARVASALVLPGSDGCVFTAAVGQFDANAWGLHDMLGNVWEWCSDSYDPYYYRNSAARNPAGPATNRERVFRGGSWFSDGRAARPAARNHNLATLRDNDVGFRVARQARPS